VCRWRAHHFDVHRKPGTPPPYWTLIKVYDRRHRLIETWGGPTWTVRTRKVRKR
jgi:hypothetical protein